MRDNPVPPGHYWVDVVSDKRPEFEAWIDRNAPHVQVRDTKTEDEYRTYVLEITEPVTWEGPGLLTIGREGLTVQETVSKPEHQSFEEQFKGAVSSARGEVAKGIVISILGISLGAWAMSKLRK